METAFGTVGFFYGMVGHGGASGYLALGALMGQPLAVLKAQALMLNLGVAGLAALMYARSGWLRLDLLLPLTLASVPAAYFTAQVRTGAALASGLLALALASSALRLLWASRLRTYNEAAPQRPGNAAILAALGLGLGALSGLTGVGGGIYLSPLLLLLRLADLKQTAAVSAAFIVANSLAGLAGLAAQGPLPGLPASWAASALAGGLAGAWLGAGRMPRRGLATVLGAVLLLAAWKLALRALA